MSGLNACAAETCPVSRQYLVIRYRHARDRRITEVADEQAEPAAVIRGSVEVEDDVLDGSTRGVHSHISHAVRWIGIGLNDGVDGSIRRIGRIIGCRTGRIVRAGQRKRLVDNQLLDVQPGAN